MLSLAISAFVFVVLFGLALQLTYVMRLRQEARAIYQAIGEPPVVPTLGMFALGDNSRLWRHLILGFECKELPTSLRKHRLLAATFLFATYPTFVFLIFAIVRE